MKTNKHNHDKLKAYIEKREAVFKMESEIKQAVEASRVTSEISQFYKQTLDRRYK